MKRLQNTFIEGEACRSCRACYDEFLTSWNKIESMSGAWEDKFKEALTSLFVEASKTMKDPRMKSTAEILTQMTRNLYENWDR